VDTSEIAADAVTAAEITTGAVRTTEIATDAVTAAEIAANAVGTSEIADNSVTLAKLEDDTQGDILYYGASGAPTRLTAGTSGQFLKTQGAAANPVWANNADTTIDSNRNRLINGDGVVDQRGASAAINDDTYAWDRWVVLSDGNGVATPSQETSDLPTGARAAMKMTVAVANKKFGILQIVEGVNCKDLISNVASLSMQLKASGLTNVRAAILSWTGTEDAVTSDVVSAWNAAGTNPTLVANWTYENTPANISVSGAAWAGDTSIANISIDTASTKQVPAFIWVDVTDAAVSDTLLVSDVQLEPGTAATGFERRPLTTELASCQRYYEKTFDLSTIPGSLTTNGQSYWVSLGTLGRFPLLFQTRKRTVPAVTSYSYATGASGVVRNTSTNVDVSAGAVNTGEQATLLTFTAASTNEFASQWVAEAEL
jgi:hypothetical protein